MKRIILKISLVLALLLGATHFAGSQPPPPPGSHGSGDNQPAPAPVGGGAAILLLMAGAYGAARAYNKRTRIRE